MVAAVGKTKERLVIIPYEPKEVNMVSKEEQLKMDEQLACSSKFANQLLGQIIDYSIKQ